MKVLINRTDAIGDTLLTLPICEKIKQKYPQAHITYMASPRCTGLLDIIGSQDEVWIVDTQVSLFSNFLSYLKKINQLKPDVYIHLGGFQWPSLICFLLGVKQRFGLVSKFISLFALNRGVRQKRSQSGKHEVNMNIEVLNALGIEGAAKERPLVRREKINDGFLKEFLADKFEENKKVVFVHPGMTGHTLNWPVKNYVLLLDQLNKSHPDQFQFVLSYTPSDAPYLEQFEEALKTTPLNNLFYFNGAEKGLSHYAQCLSQSNLFIGPSTGTTHLANILNIPTLAFYSPIKAQCATRWRPFFGLQDNLAVMEPSISCPERVKCRGESCEYYFCMEKMEVDSAYGHIKNLLSL